MLVILNEKRNFLHFYSFPRWLPANLCYATNISAGGPVVCIRNNTKCHLYTTLIEPLRKQISVSEVLLITELRFVYKE